MSPVTTTAAAATLVLLLGTTPIIALASGEQGSQRSTAAAMADMADMADGEVRKVDGETGKITLKHGPIKRLDMPPMTMVFIVKDKAMLADVKRGDKVKFIAADEGGRYTVTDLRVVR